LTRGRPSDPRDLAAAGGGLKGELEHEPLLRPERPISAILLDLVIGPRVVTASLDALHDNAGGRVGLEHGRNGRAQQPADALQPVQLRRGAVDLGEHQPDVLGPQQAHALAAMASAEALDAGTPPAARFLAEVEPVSRFVVGDGERID
jgi:hypothetical protein